MTDTARFGAPPPPPEGVTRSWRTDALERVVASRLREVGCARLADEACASQTAGTNPEDWPGRRCVDGVIQQVLDRWAADLPTPPAGEQKTPMVSACRALFSAMHNGGQERLAFPCCLKQSPCPYGWLDRWREIALDYGLGTGELSLLLGEAIQALASSPEIRGLVAEGNGEMALDLLLELIQSMTYYE